VPGLIVGQVGLVDNKHTEQTERTELYLNTGVNLVNYYQNYLDKSKDYVMIILFNLFGALLLISSFDLISLYLSIELQSFALYILATFYKESRIVTAAGLKYFLLGALSSCFILLGSAFIYAFSGLTKFDSIYCLISTFDPSVNHTQFILGIILIFIGFLFKIGAAPLHN
jgi:NADH-ubiquinone oxidoreductase chain 2